MPLDIRTALTRRRHWLWLLVAVALFGCSPTAAELQDKNWTDFGDLIDTSDRIFTAQFVESRQETVQLIDSATGALSGEADVLYRQFEVFESMKGTSDAEDLLWIAFEPGRTGELVNGQGEVQEFRSGKTYVLFLKGRLRPLQYPAEFGPVLWTGNGEPSFAELLDDNLIFRSERPYLDLLENEGHTLPVPSSASPFSMTISELRDST